MNSDDDIVTRLRHQWTNEYDATGKLLYEAEKEIEMLRQENDWYKRVNSQLKADLAQQAEKREQ